MQVTLYSVRQGTFCRICDHISSAQDPSTVAYRSNTANRLPLHLQTLHRIHRVATDPIDLPLIAAKKRAWSLREDYDKSADKSAAETATDKRYADNKPSSESKWR